MFVVSLCLFPVVIAIECSSFALATRREKDFLLAQEADERQGQGGIRYTFGLDPLIESLLDYTTQEEITARLGAMFEKLDSDQSGTLRYAYQKSLTKEPSVTQKRPPTDTHTHTHTHTHQLCRVARRPQEIQDQIDRTGV